MSTIVAGRFDTQSQVQQAIAELQRAGFPPDQIASFYVNPPGQHDRYPMGGDYEISPGAEETPIGAAAGAVAGAAAGLAAAPLLGPVGPLVGAYVGTLVGSLVETRESDEVSKEGESAPMPHEHRPGLYVAVVANDDERQHRALDIMNNAGAIDIEFAEGTIQNGDWVDFDPVSPPRLIKNGAEWRGIV